ncbi:MAG: hypothetical protein ACI3YK_06620 [Eubacteriales bacterium]
MNRQSTAKTTVTDSLKILKSLFITGAPTDSGSKRERRWVLLFCLLSSFVTLVICTRSSFLYPLNDWVDSNCFFTVGKGMFNGQVVYRDLYEQKGVLLYFLHGLCWLISHDSFLGVFFLEIIAGTFFLYYSYRIMRLYCKRACLVTLPLLAAAVYSSSSFVLGDSAEELCLPLLAYGLYVSFRSLKEKTPMGWKDALLIGVTSGAVLWIKFSMLGFYLGWIWVPAALLIRSKKRKELLRLIGGIIGGVLLITLPFFLYFAVNGALSDWFEVYFYNNIFLYHGESIPFWVKFLGVWKEIGSRLAWNHSYGFFVLLGLLFGLLCLKVGEKFQLILPFAGLAMTTYINGTAYAYYTLIFAVFAPFGWICLIRLIYAAIEAIRMLSHGKLSLKIGKTAGPVALGAVSGALVVWSLFYCLNTSQNTNLLLADKDTLPQYRFAEIINQKENATLLNYGFLDGGFYTTSNLLASCRFFCTLNMEYLPEMMETQNEWLENGVSDFVVTRSNQIQSDRYRLVDECTYELWEGQSWTFYLYERIEETESD